MKEKEAEKQQEAQQGASGGASGGASRPAPNPNYEPGGGGKGMDETTVYYNDSYGPGENPNEGVGDEIRENLDT